MLSSDSKISEIDIKENNFAILFEFFSYLENYPYVIANYYEINSKEIPNIEVYCYDKTDISQRLISYLINYNFFEFEINHRLLDINRIELSSASDNGILQWKVIIHDEFMQPSNVSVKPHFIYSVIENFCLKDVKLQNTVKKIKVPSKIDRILIKYINYLDKHEYSPNNEELIQNIFNNVETIDDLIYLKSKVYIHRKPINHEDFSSQLKFKRRLTIYQIKKIINIFPVPVAEKLTFIGKKIYALINGRNR